MMGTLKNNCHNWNCNVIYLNKIHNTQNSNNIRMLREWNVVTVKHNKPRFHDSLPLENALFSWVCAWVSWVVTPVLTILTQTFFMGFSWLLPGNCVKLGVNSRITVTIEAELWVNEGMKDVGLDENREVLNWRLFTSQVRDGYWTLDKSKTQDEPTGARS